MKCLHETAIVSAAVVCTAVLLVPVQGLGQAPADPLRLKGRSGLRRDVDEPARGGPRQEHCRHGIGKPGPRVVDVAIGRNQVELSVGGFDPHLDLGRVRVPCRVCKRFSHNVIGGDLYPVG